MFGCRKSAFCAISLSIVCVSSCAKHSDSGASGAGDDTSLSTGGASGVRVVVGGAGSTSSGVAGGATNGTSIGSGSTSNATDPNLVGEVTKLTPAQVTQISATACNAWAIEPESSPAKLQLVVDISGSMSNKAPGTNLSKWEVTRDALVDAVCGTTGAGLPESVSVGLMFYPNKFNDTVSKTAVNQSVCLNLDGITSMAMLGNNDVGTHRTALRTALTQVALGSGTPTADAYDYALNKIVLAPEQASIPGDPYILLITDGMPTLYHGCYNPAGRLQNLPGDEVVALIEGAAGKSVKTFVIGSPGSEEGKPWLSKAAYLGGTAAANCSPESAVGPYCHMDMTAAPDFSVALREGLKQVVNAVSGCKYDVPSESADGTQTVDPNAISPIINYADGSSELIGRDNANGANCTEGYRLLPGNTQLELCKSTCARFQADSKATMQLLFGCAPDEVKDIIL